MQMPGLFFCSVRPSSIAPATSSTSFNGWLFRELLQPLDGVHHHAANLRHCQTATSHPASPALEHRDTDAKNRSGAILGAGEYQ